MTRPPRAETVGTESPPSAPAMRRLGAFGVDQVVVAVYLAGLFGFVWVVSQLGLGSFVRGAFEEPVQAQLLGLILVTLPVVMYYAAWEGSPLAATPGKLLLGVRVTAAGGGPLPLGRAMVRSGVKLLPWEISHTVLWRLPGWPGAVETLPPWALAGFAFTWILVGAWLLSLFLDPEGRTAYDRAAGAVVVRAGSWTGTFSGGRLRPWSSSGFPRPGSKRSVRAMRAAPQAAWHPSGTEIER